MVRIISIFFLFTIFFISCNNQTGRSRPDHVLVIHGGAGAILKKNMTPEMENQYILKLKEALHIGDSILRSGGSSLDAVAHTVMVMENSPLFD